MRCSLAAYSKRSGDLMFHTEPIWGNCSILCIDSKSLFFVLFHLGPSRIKNGGILFLHMGLQRENGGILGSFKNGGILFLHLGLQRENGGILGSLEPGPKNTAISGDGGILHLQKQMAVF